MYSTPPSPLPPNPYKRRGFLQRKSPPSTRKSGGRQPTGTRPFPRRTPSDNAFHDSAGVGVYMASGESHMSEARGSRGSPSRDSRRCSPASSRSVSPQKRPWYPAGSPASSRSASPHKRPWYPAGCRPSSGESGRSGRGGHEETYIVHPTFRHLFNQASDGSNGGGVARGQDDGGVGDGVHGREIHQPGAVEPEACIGGSPCSSPQTKANVKVKAPPATSAPSATGDRRRETTVNDASTHRRSTEKNNLPGKQNTHGKDIDVSSERRQADNNGQAPRRKATSGGPRIHKSENGQHDTHRESVDAIRGRVRHLQRAAAKPSSRQNGLSLSANGGTRAGPKPPYLSSAVFTGHSEQVLALTQHQDVLFSAAADGTAKAWDIYSHQCLATYEGHRKAVWGMQVTSRTLITGSADGTVRFWDIETARPLHVIDLHSAVRDLVRVGGFLAVATANPSIEVIDLSCMKLHGALKGHIMAVSALASLEGQNRLVSGSHDTFVRIWDPDTGNCEAVLSGHGGTIGSLCAIAWRSPAANFNGALRGGQTIPREEESLIVSGSGDSTVRVWGRVAGTTGSSGEWACRAVLEGHRHGVWAAHGLSLSGGVFATGGGDATVKIWAPCTTTNTSEVDGTDVTVGNGEAVSERKHQHQRWECVGGVRGVAGAVGAVLMNADALVFGTSEALIARFPTHLCMPTKRRPA